jgi:hypothetical protein
LPSGYRNFKADLKLARFGSGQKGEKQMMRKLLIASLLLVPMAAPPPAFAQLMNDRVLTIFGSDPCPKDTICVRAPESERYRIPKQFRNGEGIKPENQSWAARAQSTMDAGAKTGIGSCSANGPGGWTGCWQQQMRAARAERKAAEAESHPDLDK